MQVSPCSVIIYMAFVAMEERKIKEEFFAFIRTAVDTKRCMFSRDPQMAIHRGLFFTWPAMQNCTALLTTAARMAKELFSGLIRPEITTLFLKTSLQPSTEDIPRAA